MVVTPASLKLQLFHQTAAQQTRARDVNRGISQSSKTSEHVPNALWVILPTIKCWPRPHKLGTIGAKRAQEALLGLRPEPTMPAKVVAIAPVVHIPKWQALATPIYAKNVQKVNGGYFTSLFELQLLVSM